jgi:hypothetical protein
MSGDVLIEAETYLGDIQALERKVSAKVRDLGSIAWSCSSRIPATTGQSPGIIPSWRGDFRSTRGASWPRSGLAGSPMATEL